MDKLISMTDFVMQQNMHYANKDIAIEKLQLSILNYAMFLKQPLTLGMFVPCDLDGNVLEEPKWPLAKSTRQFSIDGGKYKEAKSRVLFEDCPFEIDRLKKLTSRTETIELIDDLGLTLTQTAQKQIGL